MIEIRLPFEEYKVIAFGWIYANTITLPRNLIFETKRAIAIEQWSEIFFEKKCVFSATSLIKYVPIPDYGYPEEHKPYYGLKIGQKYYVEQESELAELVFYFEDEGDAILFKMKFR